MSGRDPIRAQASGKKRKKPAPLSVQEGDAEASTEPENAQKNSRPGSTWKNLDLILSLQDKDVPVSRKLELAFNFVTSDCGGDDRGRETVQFPRAVSFLGDWVQPLLISSDKNKTKISAFPDAWLDFRLWVIFKFCLAKSTINISQNLLKPITRVLINALLVAGKDDDSTGVGEDSTGLYRDFSECLSLLFSYHGRHFNNAGVELWVSCTVAAVGLVLKILSSGRCCVFYRDVLLHVSLLLLEKFGNFLRFHPTPKNIFRSFVDRLLEPSLELLALLHHSRASNWNDEYAGNLLTVVEDFLSNGLFHPAHISGFLSSRSSNTKTEVQESKSFNESYHRHFFGRFQKIITEKKLGVMVGFGSLFRLFVTVTRKKRVVTATLKTVNKLEKDHMALEKDNGTSKLLFGVFVQFMEPLVLECKRFTEMEFSGTGESWGTRLIEAYRIIITFNDITETFMHEKIYERSQDSAEGAHCSFLKKVYGMIIAISRKIYLLWSSISDVHETGFPEMLLLIAKELVVSIGYLIEIEYKVLGDDLPSIWFMMLSYLSVSLSTVGTMHYSILSNEILRVGCLMINVYSELRQASRPLFALCEAMRFFRFSDNGSEIGRSTFFPVRNLSFDACKKAVESLLCSQGLRSATSNAIKSIPEGQASGCLKQLKSDLTESLEWVRTSFMKTDGVYNPNFSLEAGIFGCLSEVYSTVLESLTVTATNSISVGNSINDLMASVRLVFSSTVQGHLHNFDDFYIYFTGRNLSDYVVSDASSPLDAFWIFVFFFRCYVSCRSLYLQAFSLMPPDSSRKAALIMGNFFTVSSGKDWEEIADWTDGSYFSWIVNPSVSLLIMIEFVSKTFLTNFFAARAPLVFVLHVMALQRLTDLNRQVKIFEYHLQKDARFAQVQELDNGENLPYKQNKKWKHLLEVTRQEAADLTNFMTEYMPFWASKGQLGLLQVEKASEGGETLPVSEDAWDMGVCSLNERSLPIAIWWLLCRNIDTWCVHASRRSLKKFSSLLVHHAISCSTSCCEGDTVLKRGESPEWRRISFHQISTDLLRDTAFYEQQVLLRHFTSRLSRLLKKSILPAVCHTFGTNMDLSSLPDLLEVLIRLDEVPCPPIDISCASNNNLTSMLLHSVSSDSIHPGDCTGRNLFPPIKLEARICQRLFLLLCRLPMIHRNLRFFSVMVAYILNLERLVVSLLLSSYDEFSCSHYNVLSLFVSCRRTLRHLLVASAEDNADTKNSSFLNLLFRSPPAQWLLKSVSRIVGLSQAHFGVEHSSEVNKMFFVLMDHTSYLFFTFSERRMNAVIHFLQSGGKLHMEHSMHEVPTEKDTISEVELCSNPSGYLDAWKSLNVVAMILKEETRILLLSLRNLDKIRKKTGALSVNWNNLLGTLSCFQGFIWGLVSAVGNIDGKCSNENASNSVSSCISELYNYIAVFEEFVDCCLKLSLVNDRWIKDSSITSRSHMLVDTKYAAGSDFPINKIGASRCEGEIAVKIHHMVEESGTANCFLFGPDDDVKLHNLGLPLLRSLLKGEDPDFGSLLGQLFMSTAATLRLRYMISILKGLKIQNDCIYLSNSTCILVAVSDFIWSEMTKFVKMSQFSDFVWLDGMLKYLEVLGSPNSFLPGNTYSRMINIHLSAIGKCICLQGKAATLASHETVSYTKTLQSETGRGANVCSLDQQANKLNEVKSRLRMSFKELIRRTSRSDLVLVVQALERALTGVQQGCNMVYEIHTGDKDGGKVSATVAAGIDCFDLVFGSFSGRKLLGIIKGRIQNLTGSLFNIILHLQSSIIFYREKLPCNKSNKNPDPGAVVLMCVEMLTKVARKHSLLKMDPCNVGDFLHVPASLFKHFHEFKAFQVTSCSLDFPDNGEGTSMKNMRHLIVDHEFCVDLYAACCTLLCTILRNRTSEAAHCIAVLEDSTRVLLTCLESVDADLVSQKGYFAFDIHEAAKCASFLRRIYEEVRQQKNNVQTYCSHLLCDYICVSSGYGPLKSGIKREVDEVLRPGVYALIDMCSPEDFQYLHTVLGEGPCRRTLATLRHDCELNFKYQGKI